MENYYQNLLNKKKDILDKIKENNYSILYKSKSCCDYYNKGWKVCYIKSFNEDDNNLNVIDFINNSKENIVINAKNKNLISYFRKYSKPNFIRRNIQRNEVEVLKERLNLLKNFNFDDFDDDNNENNENNNNGNNKTENGNNNNENNNNENNKTKNENNDNYSLDYPYSINLLLRWKIFYILDAVLNTNDNNEGIDICTEIIQTFLSFLNNYFIFINKNIKLFTSYLNFIKENPKNNDIILIDLKSVLFSFYDDSFNLLDKIFGSILNFDEFYINYKKDLFNIISNYYKKNKLNKVCIKKSYSIEINIKNSNNIIPAFVVSFLIDFYNNLNAFQNMSKIIISFFNFNRNENNFNNKILNPILNFFKYLNNIINNNFEFIIPFETIEIKTIIFSKIQNLNENDLKNFDFEMSLIICKNIINLLNLDKKNQQKIFEEIYLLIFYRYFLSKNIENKLFALKNYVMILKAIDKKYEKKREIFRFYSEINENFNFEEIDYKYFCEQIREKKILENIILNNNNNIFDYYILIFFEVLYENFFGLKDKEKFNKTKKFFI